MLEKLTSVTLFVSDQDRAIDFYTNTLGFQKRADHAPPDRPRYVAVGLPGQELSVVLWKGTPSPPKNAAPGGTGGAWVLATTDLPADFARLKARGVKFEEDEPIDAPYARYATLVDPDGNRIVLREPPRQSRP